MLGGDSVQSTAADALEAAGDKESAADIGALDRAAAAAERKVVSTRRGRAYGLTVPRDLGGRGRPTWNLRNSKSRSVPMASVPWQWRFPVS